MFGMLHIKMNIFVQKQLCLSLWLAACVTLLDRLQEAVQSQIGFSRVKGNYLDILRLLPWLPMEPLLLDPEASFWPHH